MVAVRLPPFLAERPPDRQFTFAGINSEQTKFCYVISQLENRYASEMEGTITSPPKHNSYITLRTGLVGRLSPSKEHRFRDLLTLEERGVRKPSQFLRHL
jgi:hypothetical protein